MTSRVFRGHLVFIFSDKQMLSSVTHFVKLKHERHDPVPVVISALCFSAVTAGQTGWRWWRGTNRRPWAASPWSCSPKRSPPSTTTSWSSNSAPTPATRGSPSSGSTGFSAAFPDTRWRTWIMHETAQVAKQFRQAITLFLLQFFWLTFFLRQRAHQLVFSNCSDVYNAQRTMPKGPVNWNTLFNYELDCQRVEFSLSQSNNVCFILFIFCDTRPYRGWWSR